MMEREPERERDRQSQRDRQPEGISAALRLNGQLDELQRLHAFFERLAKDAGWPDRLKMDLLLCCEELLTNTMTYGYPSGRESGAIDVSVTGKPGGVSIVLTDDAVPFNPLLLKEPDMTLGLEERPVGGLGVHFVKMIMDEILYEPLDSGNRLTLSKTFGPTQEENNK